jgi:hypothetical protein
VTAICGYLNFEIEQLWQMLERAHSGLLRPNIPACRRRGRHRHQSWRLPRSHAEGRVTASARWPGIQHRLGDDEFSCTAAFLPCDAPVEAVTAAATPTPLRGFSLFPRSSTSPSAGAAHSGAGQLPWRTARDLRRQWCSTTTGPSSRSAIARASCCRFNVASLGLRRRSLRHGDVLRRVSPSLQMASTKQRFTC